MPTYYMDYENGNNASSGSTWADAWKDITNGATAARIAPGDTIRIAKSASPTLVCSASWTNLSKLVVLDTPQTMEIDYCESMWTTNPSGDLSGMTLNSSRKEGSQSGVFQLDATPQASTLQAYKTISTSGSDFSSYQKISFWVIPATGSIPANAWYLALCDDSSGSSPIDTFQIPESPANLRYAPFTVARDGGGNCGSGIKSVALYTGTSPKASTTIRLDNIIACTTNGLNLQSLISKNSLEQGGTEYWYGIQAINGSKIYLDNGTNNSGATGRGYFGTTEYVSLYKRETIKTPPALGSTTVVQEVMDSGTSGEGNIEFQGGYDVTTNLQTGETFFDGLNGQGLGIQCSGKSYITLNHLSFCRYYEGYHGTGSSYLITINNSFLNNNSQYGFYTGNAQYEHILNNIIANNGELYGIYCEANNSSFGTITVANNLNAGFLISCIGTITQYLIGVNNSYGISFSTGTSNFFTTASLVSNITNAITFSNSSHNYINNLYSSSHGTCMLYGTTAKGYLYIKNSMIADTTKSVHNNPYGDTRIYYEKYNGNYARMDTRGGNVVEQSATAGGTGNEWKISITLTERAFDFPLKFELAQIACNPNQLVTVTCYFKKSHATDIAAALVCSGSQLAGINTSASAVCPNDTNRNQLQIQFTPTEAGVVAIEAWGWYVANAADENVIIDDIYVTQG